MGMNPLRRGRIRGHEPRSRRVAHAIAVVAVWMASVFAADAHAAGDRTWALTVGGIERSYVVHVPAGLDLAKPASVVLAFHGGGTHAQAMEEFSGLNQKADEAGFIVVYPNGTGRLRRVLTFNGGNCCGYAMDNGVDDVEFTRKILDDLATRVDVDAKRIFATGMSNGAIMVYRLAAELSDRIAAIAPVGGPMGIESPNPGRPVSVIHFHGTDDTFAPYAGGKGRRLFKPDFYSVGHSIRAWVEVNGCGREPVVAQLPDTFEDGTSVTRKTYGPGKDGAEVTLIEIAGGGHTWPGREPHRRFLGRSTRDISANDLMWDFFKRHPMR